MKKNIFKIIFISFFLFLIFPFNAKAYGGYIIENYDVNIKVNENNVLNVTETIDVNFTSAKHGIKRNIPYINTYYRSGFNVTTKAKIKNISVNDKYSKSKERGTYSTGVKYGEVVLKIGSSSKTITGNKEYVIKYDYDIGDDNVDDYDDLYFNIIGTNWDTSIKNVSFTIQMPKEFDETLINFPMGKYGSTYNEDVVYNVNGNVITGTINKDSETGYALNSYEGLTVRIELPEGYFTGERPNYDLTGVMVYGGIILSVLIIILSILLFKKYGHKKKDLLVVEYSVPDDLSPAEAGYLYAGRTNNNQIISLIIYLANKGYLEIIENSKTEFSFKKLKDIDENEPNYVKITFNGLFKRADKDGIVDKDDLKDKFYITLTSALNQLSKTHKIYNGSHYGLYGYYTFAIILEMCLLPFISAFSSYRLEYNYNIQYVICVILAIISNIISILLIIFNKKRTEEATKYYNKLRGFKEYITKVEKNKLETLVKENPNYFYDILPYAYVLGVSNVWSKKFESIAITPPTWYTGTMYNGSTGMFNPIIFNNSLNKTLAYTNSTMSSRPYESSGTSGGGSFSGGGGFSGGGAGGGGGSSW